MTSACTEPAKARLAKTALLIHRVSIVTVPLNPFVFAKWHRNDLEAELMRERKQTCYGLEYPRFKVSSGDDDGTLGAVAHEYFPYSTPYDGIFWP